MTKLLLLLALLLSVSSAQQCEVSGVCGCSADRCNEDKCSSVEGVWSAECPGDPCTCRGSEAYGNGTATVDSGRVPPSRGEETSCYDERSQTCECSADTCDEDKCTAAGKNWTDSCPNACNCRGGAAAAPATVDSGRVPVSAGEVSAGEEAGCYDEGAQQCVCSAGTCDEASCTAAGRNWTDTCQEACTCRGGAPDGTAGVPAALGAESSCYDVRAQTCGCSADTCTEASCTAAGKNWSDTCPNACNCRGGAAAAPATVDSGRDPVSAGEEAGCYDEGA